MFKPVKSLGDFLSYWYFRYLMVTELYIVERWEQRVTNVAFLLLFLLFWYFNCTVLVNITSSLSSISQPHQYKIAQQFSLISPSTLKDTFSVFSML